MLCLLPLCYSIQLVVITRSTFYELQVFGRLLLVLRARFTMIIFISRVQRHTEFRDLTFFFSYPQILEAKNFERTLRFHCWRALLHNTGVLPWVSVSL